MATLEQLSSALVKADAAGNADDAHAIASEIRRMRQDATTAKAAPAAEAHDPTGSFGENLLAGVGKAFVDTGRGLKQLIDIPAAALERTFGGEGASRALGMPTAQESAQATQADIDEAKQRDAPLMKTAGGLIGNIAGQTAMFAVPGAAIAKAAPVVGAANLVARAAPRAASFVAPAISGGVIGAAQPVATGDSRLEQSAFGAAGGVAGKFLGDAIGKAAGSAIDKAKTAGANMAAARGARDATLQAARESGYVVPPVHGKEGFVNRTLESIGGKAQTQQAASLKNQQVTNRLALEALTDGLDNKTAELIKSQPLNKDLLGQIRAGAGGAYEAMAQTGPVRTDDAFRKSLGEIGQQARQISKDFPDLKVSGSDEINALLKGLGVDRFDARSGVELVKNLRAEASGNLGFQASGDPAKQALGRSQRAAADAIDDLLERNADAVGLADLGAGYKEARRLIAKTYAVESSMNEATGNVLAKNLAKQLQKGKPLSPKLETIAKFAGAFPKASEEVVSSPGVSALDFFGSGLASASTGNSALMGGVMLRPAVRSLILSSPYQNALLNPSYGPGLIKSGTFNALRSSAPVVGLPGGVAVTNALRANAAE